MEQKSPTASCIHSASPISEWHCQNHARPAAGFASSSGPSCPSKQIQEAYTAVMRWRPWRKMFSHAPSQGTRSFCSESAPHVASPGRDLPACRGWHGWRFRSSQGSLDNIQGPSRAMWPSVISLCWLLRKPILVPPSIETILQAYPHPLFHRNYIANLSWFFLSIETIFKPILVPPSPPSPIHRNYIANLPWFPLPLKLYYKPILVFPFHRNYIANLSWSTFP